MELILRCRRAFFRWTQTLRYIGDIIIRAPRGVILIKGFLESKYPISGILGDSQIPALRDAHSAHRNGKQLSASLFTIPPFGFARECGTVTR